MSQSKITFIILENIDLNLKKIKSQNIDDYEIIYINNLRKEVEVSEKIVVLNIEENISIALGHAISIAKFKYIKIIDFDFHWDESFLINQLSTLYKDTECSIVCSRIENYPSDSSQITIDPNLAPISEDGFVITRETAEIFHTKNNTCLAGYLSQCLFKKGTKLDIYQDIFSSNGKYYTDLSKFILISKFLSHGHLTLKNDLPFFKSPTFEKNHGSNIIKKENIFFKEQSNYIKKQLDASDFLSTNLRLIENHNSIVKNIEEKEKIQYFINNLKLNKKQVNFKKIALIKNNQSKSTPIPIILLDYYEEITPTYYLENHSKWDWVISSIDHNNIIPEYFFQLYLELNENPPCKVVTTDSVTRNTNGILEANFLPSNNLDLILSKPSLYSRLIACKSDLFYKKYKDYSNTSELNFEIISQTLIDYGISSLGHFPHPIAIFKRKSNPANTYLEEITNHLYLRGLTQSQISFIESDEPSFIIKYSNPKLIISSIIQESMLSLEKSLKKATQFIAKNENICELILYRNPREKIRDQVYINKIKNDISDKIRILYSYIGLADAILQARGDAIVYISNQIDSIDNNALDELLHPLVRNEVAATSIQIKYHDEKIQSSGYAIGLRDSFATPLLNGISISETKNHINLKPLSNYSILSNDIFAVQRAKIVEFIEKNTDKKDIINEYFLEKVSSGEFLLCSSNANAKLIQHYSDNRKISHSDQIRYIRNYTRIIKNDIGYNKSWSLKDSDFSVNPYHSPNYSESINKFETKNIACYFGDKQGCGHYRIIHPADSININAIGSISLYEHLPNIYELIRFDIESLVIQRPIYKDLLGYFKLIRNTTNITLTAEADDNYLDIHQKHPLYKTYNTKYLEEILKSNLSLVDKFIVSTENLASRYSHLHKNIIVIENKLPLHPWYFLQAHPVIDRKPRVGWGGGSSHQGDLDLISGIVKDLKDTVDWIFFGMCPDSLKSYAKEIHEGVDFHSYPAKLHSLDLDVAIAPLEENLFNYCKSSLRLLEFGACGFPVICSNFGPYSSSLLPVTSVNNNFKEWKEAILWHCEDLHRSKIIGINLQKNVRENYMLEQFECKKWLKAWI